MKSILIMDDDLSFSHTLARDLRDLGYDVDTVSNASDAVESVSGKDYTAVVVDMIVKTDNRPVPDGGLILIHRLRSLQSGDQTQNGVLIIGISGVTKYPGLGTVLRAAKSLGADAVMEKPLRATDLADEIEALT